MNPDRLVYHIPVADTHIDRYLKWLPTLAVLLSRRVGLVTTHNTPRQALLIAVSTLIREAVTQGLKHTIHRNRPFLPLDGRSFPSSHTAVAIAGAELLRQELRPTHSLWRWSGYVPAAATAVLRLSKRRHWPTDVLAGAVIGIGSVWLAGRLVRRARPKDAVSSRTA